MLSSLVLTVIGPDRTGLVETIAATATDYGANWLESRMARLAGQFAGVIHLHVERVQAEPLTTALKALSAKGLSITVHMAADEAPATDLQHLHLELLGHDRPAIVRDVTRALAAANVNVVELETACYSAPMTGEPMFKAEAQLTAPAETDLDHLHATLDRIAEDLQLDLHLEPLVRV